MHCGGHWDIRDDNPPSNSSYDNRKKQRQSAMFGPLLCCQHSEYSLRTYDLLRYILRKLMKILPLLTVSLKASLIISKNLDPHL